MSSVNRPRGGDRPLWLGRALAGAGVASQSRCQESWKEPALGSFHLWHWGHEGRGPGQPRAEGSQTSPALGTLPCLAAAAAPGAPTGPRERVPMRNKPISQHTDPGRCLGCGP